MTNEGDLERELLEGMEDDNTVPKKEAPKPEELHNLIYESFTSGKKTDISYAVNQAVSSRIEDEFRTEIRDKLIDVCNATNHLNDKMHYVELLVRLDDADPERKFDYEDVLDKYKTLQHLKKVERMIKNGDSVDFDDRLSPFKADYAKAAGEEEYERLKKQGMPEQICVRGRYVVGASGVRGLGGGKSTLETTRKLIEQKEKELQAYKLK